MRTKKGDAMNGLTTYAPVTSVQFRGRKMKPGKYLPGPARVFITYCGGCNEKVTIPMADMKHFMIYYRKQRQSMRVKLVRWLMKGLQSNDL